jgi:HEAT repeat protein
LGYKLTKNARFSALSEHTGQMRNGYRYLLALVATAVLAVIAWASLSGPPNPVYQGKRLSVWLKRYDNLSNLNPYKNLTDRQEPDTAVRQIGTNSIPMLLSMLRAKDSNLTLKTISLLKKQHFLKFNYVTAQMQENEAAEAFQALGASASNAVPELVKMYSVNNSINAQYAIVLSLAHIGPEAKGAIPLLLQLAATNKNEIVAGISVNALGFIHGEPDQVVPALRHLLHDPNSHLQLFAAQSLADFGVDAKPATSDILELLHDGSEQLRGVAHMALIRIYDKLERSPPKPPARRKSLPSSDLIRAIDGFAVLGTNAAPAVPALIKFLDDPDEAVRISATNALKAIDPKAAMDAAVR